MSKFRKGDIVGRISYNKDVIFEITKIIKTSSNNEICILKGITERIVADSPPEDLEIMDKRLVSEKIKSIEDKIESRIQKCIKCGEYNVKRKSKMFYFINNEKRGENTNIYTGKILHLDGDRKYAKRALNYYNNLDLKAVVENIPEREQPRRVLGLLEKWNPDILIVTGHDKMFKKGQDLYKIENYKNSKYFIETVMIARKWENSKGRNLAIFAGACQSYYEAIILAGANFASSPKRIMIDFIDPLIVAEKIAITDSNKYLRIEDIEEEIREGRAGVDGVGSMGKRVIVNNE